MIRIGSSSTGVLTNFNSFHSTSKQTSGLFSNSDSSSGPTGFIRTRYGYEDVIPPFPSSFVGKTIFVWRDPASTVALPASVENVYLELTKVSGGYQVAKFSGYSGVPKWTFATDPYAFELALSHGLQTNDKTYVRIGDLLPTKTDFIWLSSASGTVPRTIVGYQSGIVRSGQSFSSSLGNGTIRIFSLAYGSADLSIAITYGPSFQIQFPLNTWSGSGLGGATFEVVIFTEDTRIVSN